MKKQYQKPALYAEGFVLAEHISQACAFMVNFAENCKITDGHGLTMFTSACGGDAIGMWEDAGIIPNDAKLGDLGKIGYECYNSFYDFTSMIGS